MAGDFLSKGRKARAQQIRKARREREELYAALLERFGRKPTPEEVVDFWSEERETEPHLYSSRLAAAKLELIEWDSWFRARLS